MNSVNVVGRLGKDANLRYTPSGTPVADFTLAIDMGKDKEGNKKDALWVKVVMWARQAEVLAQYLTKGKQIGLVAELSEPEAWVGRQDDEPKARIVLTARSITFCGGGKSEGNDRPASEPAEPADDRNRGQITDEDIPF